MANTAHPRRLTVVLFEDFELLDVFGPLELFGQLPEQFELALIGPVAGTVRSVQGPAVLAECSYKDAPAADLVLVPGGIGTRAIAQDDAFLSWLVDWTKGAEIVTAVCTGSGVLAAAGLLEGYRATSNKQAFGWAASQGRGVKWVAEARWIEDRNRWTSSGVAAGMDMALALIAHLHGEELAARVADDVELEWHRDPTWDPFAAKNGLVPELGTR